MKRFAPFFSWIALLGTILTPCLFFYGEIDLPQVKQILFLLALVWFIFTPLWMEHSSRD